MGIHSASIITKKGEILVSRQFSKLSKLKMEEYMSNLPKLISSEQQHSFIELESVRYLYQPVEEYYLVLLTSKGSNIIEDLEVLKLLYSLLLLVCKPLEEQTILDNYLTIILGFDDVVSLGYRESVTLTQIQSYLLMESANEKVHIKQQKMKESEAQDDVKRRQHEIELKRKAAEKEDIGNIMGGGLRDSDEWEAREKLIEETAVKSPPTKIPRSRGAGMQLFTKDKKSAGGTGTSMGQGVGGALPNLFGGEPTNIHKMSTSSIDAKDRSMSMGSMHNPLSESIAILNVEKISSQISKDGDLGKLEIKGELYLRLYDQTKVDAHVQLTVPKHKGLKIMPHPDLKRSLWNSKKILAPQTLFPLNTKIEALKYKYSTTDETEQPCSFTVWSAASGQNTQFTLEVDYNEENNKFKKLDNIKLNIMLPTSEIEVKNIERSEYKYKAEIQCLVWEIEEISAENPRAVIKISANCSPESIFPIDVNFTMEESAMGIQILGAFTPEKEPVSNIIHHKIMAENYQIVDEISN